MEKWSWTDCSHSHCLFGEDNLDVLERREDWEALCVDYVRRAVHDVGHTYSIASERYED